MDTEHSKIKKRKSRVDWQVSVLTAAIVIVSCSLIFFINYRLSYNNMIDELQSRASTIRDTLEDEMIREMFTELNVREDDQSELYQIAKDKMEDIRKVTSVRYLYTAKKTTDGDFIYLVDGLPSDNDDFRYIGDLIEPECIPDLQRALNGETVLPNEINHTTWGNVFISYFPIVEDDEIAGVLGIEFDANRQYATFRTMRIVTPLVILAACFVAAFIAIKLFKRISNPTYQDLANTDFLTGLKNRNALEVDLSNFEFAGEYPFSVLMLDLDGLKQVNDNYGHSAGDQYIKRCCDIIRSCIPDDSAVYRMGGDEFIVILKNYTPDYLKDMVHTMVHKVKEENEKQAYLFSISIGYAVYDTTVDKNVLDTIKRADSSMYEYKKKHKISNSDKDV